MSLKNNATNLGILFFIWPVAALITSIKNYRENWAKNGVWLFVIFFGFTFIPQEGQDSMRYIEYFKEFHDSEKNIYLLSKVLYAEGTNYVDIFQPLITFLVAKITGDQRILFAVYGFIFGFFYSRNIWYFINKTESDLTFHSKIFIITFILIVPFWYINGVRFWSAAHIFLFGALKYLFERNRKGIWISFLSILMHFSFIFPVLIILFYNFLGNRTTIYFLLFMISIFISEINIPLIREVLLSITPEVFHPRIESYTLDQYIEIVATRKTGLNWYAIWYLKALNTIIYVFILIVFFKGKNIYYQNKELNNLFSFFLLFGGIARILSQIPSVGRFVNVSNLFSAGFLFLYFYHNKNEMISKHILIVFLPVFFLFYIVSFRIGFDNIGLFTLITNPFIAPFIDNNIALIDLIK